MSAIFFLHVHKTGGTSINQAAVEQFSRRRVLMLYGQTSQWTTPTAWEIMQRVDLAPAERLLALSDHIERNDIAYFASHMPASRLRCFEPSRAFTVLREPVDRVLAQYFFLRQKRRTAESLETFIENPEQRNCQSRALRGVTLESLATVGVLEQFEAFVMTLNERLRLQFRVWHRKRGGVLKTIRSKLVRRPLRERIAALNLEDAALYERALEVVRRDAGNRERRARVGE